MKAVDFNNNAIVLSNSLKPYALRLTHNMEDAQDLVQETMFKVFANTDKFEDGTNLKAWMFTIMKNIFINNYRKKVKQNTIIDLFG